MSGQIPWIYIVYAVHFMSPLCYVVFSAKRGRVGIAQSSVPPLISAIHLRTTRAIPGQVADAGADGNIQPDGSSSRRWPKKCGKNPVRLYRHAGTVGHPCNRTNGRPRSLL